MTRFALLCGTPLLVLLACSPQEPPERAEESASDTAEPADGPVRGDWLVLWLLADPESLNPLTSNDIASNQVLGPIIGSLLGLHPQTLERLPVVASELPTVSADHLTYTFRIRGDVSFSDGRPLTVEDVLFSLKAIKNPEVNAAPLRNYFLSIVGARALDDRTIAFRASEPYFRNDAVLGGIPILPRHFYDPAGDLEGITVAELAAWNEIDPEKKKRALRFAKAFNRDFHRKVLGSGAYVLERPERDLITGERIVLRHHDHFWAPGDPLRGDGYVERLFYRV
ncbi:MAG: ABC transporter substrate-binding protein, partial [Candidatus Binatia bacterium]